MTTLGLIKQSRDLVNRYFKISLFAMIMLGIYIIMNFVIGKYTQHTELSLMTQIHQHILSGSVLQTSEGELTQYTQFQQVLHQLFTFFSRPDIGSIILALLGIQLGLLIIGSFVNIGMIHTGIEIAKQDSEKSWKVFFKNRNMLGPYWGTNIIEFCLIGLGIIVFIIPGIYIACRLYLSTYVLLDKKCSILEAIRTSRILTRGNTRMIFKTLVLLGLIQIIGLLAVGIGLLRTYPMIYIASGSLYHQLSRNNS